MMFMKFKERLSKQKVKTVMVSDYITYCDVILAWFARTTFMEPNDSSNYEQIYKTCPLLKTFFY